jgi:hypothetical protein
MVDGTSIASALVYAAGAVNIYNQIASIGGLSSLGDEFDPNVEIFCKPVPEEPSDEGSQPETNFAENFVENAKNCFDTKGGIYREIVGTFEEAKDFNVGQNILNFLSLLNKASQPTNLLECANPIFSKFFYLIPYQLIIKDLLSKALEGLGDKDKQEVFNKLGNKCGPELKLIYETTDPLDLGKLEPFNLPPLPYVRIPKLADIIRKFIMDAYCLGLCTVLTPFMDYLAKKLVNKLSKIDALGPDSNLTIEVEEYEKRDLSEYVIGQALVEAVRADLIRPLVNGYDKSIRREENLTLPLAQIDSDGNELVANIRDLFNLLYNDPAPEVEGGKMAFLMFGQATCETLKYIADNIISKDGNLSTIFETPGLSDQQKQKKVLDFFRFIGEFSNKISLVNDSIPPDCPIEPCTLDDIDIQDISGLCLPEPELDTPDFSGLFGLDGASAAVFRMLVQPVFDKYQVARRTYNFGEYKKDGFISQGNTMNVYIKNIFNVQGGSDIELDYSDLLFGPRNESDETKESKNSKLVSEYEDLKAKEIFESGFDMSETDALVATSSDFLSSEEKRDLSLLSEAWLTKIIKLENGVV